MTEKQVQITILPEYPLTVANTPEYRKHLALIGDVEWARYWQMDILAYASNHQYRSFVISGPKDDALRAMPSALGLTNAMTNIREELPYTIDPAMFRERMDTFASLNSDTELAVMVAGRDLKHVWPFILGKKRDLQTKFTFGIADMTPNLKLPLSDSFRYFLVQEAYQNQVEAAIERWHRHESIKPKYTSTPIRTHGCLLYEVKDSN